MTYAIYRLLTRLLFALTFPGFLIYSGITGRHRAGLRQRLGFYNDIVIPVGGAPVIWIHGASIGEILAAGILTAKIKKKFPAALLILSTVTAQGLEIARKQCGTMAKCILAPLDLPGAAARAVAAIRPDLYICLETELWPNLLSRLRANNTRLFLLNGRLSERSYRRYRLVKKFSREILNGFEIIATITDADADRFAGLGADRKKIKVTGNIKYDPPEPVSAAATREEWRRQLNLGDDRPVLVAGSTHTGEEEMLLEVFHGLQDALAGLVLIIAPRHLRRIDEIREALDGAGTGYELLSTAIRKGRRAEIIIVDTVGELAELYAAADFIFCGGSLVPRGGHNIIEAAIWGTPVFYGPCMDDFSDAGQLLEGHGGIMVKNRRELAERIKELFQKPEIYAETAKAARLTARSQQGAAARQLAPVFDALRTICSNNAANNST
ncbi:MAG: glycosyltransferase N-terminal domain-containing protein [Desulfurivibrionaceae bacterium]|nr:glycosyltransferase N-terminal domain-containing protein [Desulfobulbales bacterium]MDT8334886.1 glycosyltransferase N-terminal domain-containing protein [Desulfurivibrionaceae bacterium]